MHHVAKTSVTTRLSQTALHLAGQSGRMAAAWACLGMLSGLSYGHAENAGAIGYLAHLIASLITYAFLGGFLGLFSARRKEAVLGALAGFGVVALVVQGTTMHDALMRITGLNIGGLIGITCWPIVRLFLIIAHWPARCLHGQQSHHGQPQSSVK